MRQLAFWWEYPRAVQSSISIRNGRSYPWSKLRPRVSRSPSASNRFGRNSNTYVNAVVTITPNSIPIRNRRIIFLFPTVPYLSLVTRRQAGSVQPRMDTNEHEWLLLTLKRGNFESTESRMSRMLGMTKHECFGIVNFCDVSTSTRRFEGPTWESPFAKCSKRVSNRFPHNRARCDCASRLFAAMELLSVDS